MATQLNGRMFQTFCVLIGATALGVGLGTGEVFAAKVLFVGDILDAADEPSNESVVERLMDLGHEVEQLDDDDALDFDATGNDLIVISSTTLSTNVDITFTEEPIPLINWENALSDELLFSDGGQTADSDVIDVLDTSHPMAGLMGLDQTGEVVVRDFAASFHMIDPANLAPGALVIAEDPGSGGVAVAVFDEGAELVDGSPAAATRISLFYGDPGLLDVTDEGLAIFDGAVNYALGNFGNAAPELKAGDADMDLDFDQLDLVKVQVAGKYLNGQPATWGDGDWDGAPGGEQGSPPAGNGLFDQLDIIGALGAGAYLTGPYAAVASGGVRGDGQTSIGYDPATGEVFVDAPAGIELTSVNMDSAGGIFTGEAALSLGGSFDNDADGNIFKATFGGSFGSLSFGNVAQAGLAQDFVMNDLTVVGSLSGGGDLGAVDLIYVPEPSAIVMLILAGLAVAARPFRSCWSG